MVTALEGTVVVEVAGHVAAPYAGSLLGDLGCEVIKVELPDGGDTHRGRNPKYEGYGPSFRALNRNKKSLTLDLKKKEGREVLLKLLDRADVLIENFRPATRSRLGLDYEALAKRNPRLIHCSISGYGQSGPYRDKPGFDTIAQALSGMLNLVTDRDAPKVVGVSLTDHSTGIFATYGIMAALLARYRTGRGQFVDSSLLQVTLSFIESHVVDFLNGGESVSRDNFPRGRIYCFLASDDLPLVIHLSGHQEAWEAFLDAAGRSDLLDNPRFATRRDRSEHHWEIVDILAESFRQRPRAHWLAALDANRVPNAPLNSIEEVFEDPQIQHLGFPREIEHPSYGQTRLIGSAVNLSETPAAFLAPAPLLGEHTTEVLQGLGYDEEEIRTLRDLGAI
ncbi:MAG: CaiB/BaiF CoA-transferase family protein [Chloroflexota bacterium]|nr:CaiB/BaiF CoA-transferase family protein [Chloroflexota bacterium]MDE2886443.1 CaiB/BaiF CoA-transferase family protein [Chloroflexota bacterium]